MYQTERDSQTLVAEHRHQDLFIGEVMGVIKILLLDIIILGFIPN